MANGRRTRPGTPSCPRRRGDRGHPVLASEGSDHRLRTWARDTAAALPNGTHRSLPGEWHGVAPADLAAAISAFCLDA
ncbi:hypothetical protein [Labedaea rhizosphaerae]|uniref:hypothetical protein n=1 Tax=Labedaea rhizosphaerae TaxID=598644 RepID=UPI00105F5295|nr:hypothetical protein [Labedaea rhizosphaerae]